MGIAYIGDLHFGARSSSPIFHAYFEEVIDGIFQTIIERGITSVVQLGDLFDDRKHLSLFAWDSFNRAIVDNIKKLNNKDFRWYQLVGNHDSRYRNTLSLNTPRLRLSVEDGFVVIDEPGEYIVDGIPMLMIPWITPENESRVFELVDRSESKFCCGHFEFAGFDFAKGIPGKATLSHAAFSKFESVFSGHYHTMSVKDNVCYVGTPYELTWVDCDDPKGFLIHTESGIEHIPTNKTIHSKINYSVGGEVSAEQVTGKYVRVIVNGRPDKADYFRFVGMVESLSPIDMVIQENFQDELVETATTVKLNSTREVIFDYLEKSTIDLDKIRLMSIFDDLHIEALNAE